MVYPTQKRNMKMTLSFHFIASDNPKAQGALPLFVKKYGQSTPEKADVIIVLGGDGFILHALQKYISLNKPFYGIHYGTIGFLMNESPVDQLVDYIQNAQRTLLHPLKMTAIDSHQCQHVVYAFNEVSLLRHSALAAHIGIQVNGVERLDLLMCDGILVATPAGSSAYNLSAHGPIIPIGAKLLAMTPISPFRPRRWRGALLPDTATIKMSVLDSHHRPVNASADAQLIERVVSIQVEQDLSMGYELLFNPGHNLEDRILQEQFMV